LPPLLQKGRTTALRLSEHGDVIETQTVIVFLCDMHKKHACHTKFVPPKVWFSSKLGPWKSLLLLQET